MTTVDKVPVFQKHVPERLFMAKQYRWAAEAYGDALYFRIAAAEFRALGMPLAADSCDEKARHYET